MAKGSLKWVSNKPREGYRLSTQDLLEAGFVSTQVSTQAPQIVTDPKRARIDIDEWDKASEAIEDLANQLDYITAVLKATETSAERAQESLGAEIEAKVEALARVASLQEDKARLEGKVERLEGRLEERQISYEGLLAIVSPILTLEAEAKVSGYSMGTHLGIQAVSGKTRRWWRKSGK
jgi:chaperonin cofactor prefoldin